MAVKSSELYRFIPMKVQDLDMIYELEKKSYDFPWTKAIIRDCILYNYDSYSVFFGDTLVGYVISKISYPETHILNLTVSTQFRNNGIGGSLIQLIINDARVRNSQDIILEVRSSNIVAQSLYKKLLFKQIGVRKDYYDCHEGREDAFVLKLEL